LTLLRDQLLFSIIQENHAMFLSGVTICLTNHCIPSKGITPQVGRHIDADGTQRWHVDGQLHRLDGPAVIYADGLQEWYVDGQLHRLDGPAVIYADGSQEWHVDGQLHRLDGPAVIHADGSQEWWLHGKNMTDEIKSWMRSLGVACPWDDDVAAQFLLAWG
jgi:hypothetical protein